MSEPVEEPYPPDKRPKPKLAPLFEAHVSHGKTFYAFTGKHRAKYGGRAHLAEHYGEPLLCRRSSEAKGEALYREEVWVLAIHGSGSHLPIPSDALLLCHTCHTLALQMKMKPFTRGY